MRDKIIAKLQELEQSEDVTVLFAVESGSRAWGFASKDSDYDVRFVYKHNDPHEYLKLEERRDVLEWELNDVYDISGWDLDKTLKLLHASNPVIFEWIDSPIVYVDDGFLERLRILAKPYFMSVKGANHYLHMAKRNYEMYLKDRDEVKLKKYFYVLRPILSVRYILEYRQAPPMLFEELARLELDESIKTEVDELLKKKKDSDETGLIGKIDSLNGYIEKQLAILPDELNKLNKGPADWQKLDEFFIQEIERKCR